MGIGGFLASQSERDHYRYLRQQTAARVDRSCAGEMDREVAEILSPLGVSDKACNGVAQSLREAEEEYDERLVSGAHGDPETASLRWSKDVGLTAFFLKFGKGMGTLFSSFLCYCSLIHAVFTQRKSKTAGCISPPLQLAWATSLVDSFRYSLTSLYLTPRSL